MDRASAVSRLREKMAVVARQRTVFVIVAFVLVLATACGSTARSSRPFSVKEVTQAFAKQGFTLVRTPPDMMGYEPAIALSQKTLTGTLPKLTLHSRDFVVFVFSKIATVRSAQTRAAAAAFADNSRGTYSSVANVIVIWHVRSDNDAEIAQLKRAVHALQR
jgi:hypothetical protein